MGDMEMYIELIQRVTRLEEAEDRATEDRQEMKTGLTELKTMLVSMAHAKATEKARMGGILWAGAAMATALSTLLKFAWDWFHKGG